MTNLNFGLWLLQVNTRLNLKGDSAVLIVSIPTPPPFQLIQPTGNESRHDNQLKVDSIWNTKFW